LRDPEQHRVAVFQRVDQEAVGGVGQGHEALDRALQLPALALAHGPRPDIVDGQLARRFLPGQRGQRLAGEHLLEQHARGRRVLGHRHERLHHHQAAGHVGFRRQTASEFAGDQHRLGHAETVSAEGFGHQHAEPARLGHGLPDASVKGDGLIAQAPRPRGGRVPLMEGLHAVAQHRLGFVEVGHGWESLGAAQGVARFIRRGRSGPRLSAAGRTGTARAA
jgi:hypothetical protein